MKTIVFKTDGECRINATTWPELPINVNGSVGIMPFSCNPTQKLVVNDNKHLKIGSESPKEKLSVKGRLNLKSILILFYKKYFK